MQKIVYFRTENFNLAKILNQGFTGSGKIPVIIPVLDWYFEYRYFLSSTGTTGIFFCVLA